jgi:N-acetylglucosaminyldiphosphoundecaprenol N-acetyl-beta-D-mannosaminyltransferase
MMKETIDVGRFEIEGQTINVTSVNDAVDSMIDRLKLRESFLVFTLNLDHLVKLRSDEKFRDAYRSAGFVTADGFPVVTLAGLDGILIERTAGSDLILPMCRSAAANGLSIFLFGTTLPALCAAARSLFAQIPGLDIRGVFSPPGGFSENSDIADEAIRVIAESGARICFVALGPPKQEIFAAAAKKRTLGVAFFAVGAGLDFIAGTQTRCPPLFRRLNMEWAWRFVTNPKRLGWRYFRCALLFAELLGRRLLNRPRKADGAPLSGGKKVV